ncbi:hypothetical protein ACEWY4_026058 [Coilia grayii]|uniref:IRG-type G domain-containing protein n=1 Tax=Coilia grayii TaxID=363190 RepID=A0ABD1ITS6_9TELE
MRSEVFKIMTPTMYPHPTMPNVNIWDLPGIGSEHFRVEEYTEKVHFNTYDFFLILTSERLTQNDIMLAKEIEKNNKNFYFIRTKIDQDVEAEKRKGKTEEQTVTFIRHALKTKLKDFDSNPIFLVSSWNIEKFDFSMLMDVLQQDLPENKTNALIQSLPVYSMKILDKKYNTFKKEIWAQALVSGVIGAIPVPGVSSAFDVPMILAFLTKCYFSFGLNENSLKKLSERVNKPMFAKVHESKLIKAIYTRSMACLAVELSSYLALEGLEAALKTIPILGSVTGAVMSTATTLLALKKGLDELYRAAKEVVEMAGLDY